MRYELKLTSLDPKSTHIFILKDLNDLCQIIANVKNERDSYSKQERDLIDKKLLIDFHTFTDKDND